MYLGIEIGGTKLQLAVGSGDGSEFVAEERSYIQPARGAAGILDQIERTASTLLQKRPVQGIGIGFGGPVQDGVTITSHQIDGWDSFPLSAWCQKMFGCATVVGNDCNAAALAEARFGAGRGYSTVFYVTVGTGVGGGLVIDGRLHGAGRPAIAEIGHLRPGLHATHPEATVESIASGWGIAAEAQNRISGNVAGNLEAARRAAADSRESFESLQQADEEYLGDLLDRCHGSPEIITARMIAQAAAEGNEVAVDILTHACQVLGWAIAQVITLVAPDIVVVGGGVSLAGEHLFLAPLRLAVERYVFPPLAESYELFPAALGESVVLHGALALARDGGDAAD